MEQIALGVSGNLPDVIGVITLFDSFLRDYLLVIAHVQIDDCVVKRRLRW